MNAIMRNHVLQPQISGIFVSFPNCSVVELDIPYDDAQVPAYGPAFKAWTEDDIDAAFAAIKDACPWSQLAYVVLQFSYHSGRFIIRLLNERLSNDFLRRIVKLLMISSSSRLVLFFPALLL